MPDMIAARQELDLRPQLERLDRLIFWSEGIDEGALGFAFRPLWQLDEPARAALALQKAQTTQVYAGLTLWPDAVLAKLAEAQLVADGTYPNAAAVFAEGGTAEAPQTTADAFPVRPGFNLAQMRDPDGRWTAEGGSTSAPSIVPVPHHIDEDPDPTPEEEEEELEERLKEQDGPLKRFRFGPDPSGIVRIPMMPGGGGAPPSSGSNAAARASSAPPPPVQPPNMTLQDLARVTRGFAGPKSAQKWLNQMNDRGWTPEQIEEAIQNGERISEPQRVDPTHGATRYVHPRTDRSVTIDDITGKIIQLGGDGFDY